MDNAVPWYQKPKFWKAAGVAAVAVLALAGVAVAPETVAALFQAIGDMLAP